MTAGFYGVRDGEIRYAERVATNGRTLRPHAGRRYRWPAAVNGWSWFSSAEQAERLLVPEKQAAIRSGQWVQFGATLLRRPEINQLLAAANANGVPAIPLGLASGLTEAADGDPRLFIDTWTLAKQSALVPDAVAALVRQIANEHNIAPAIVRQL